MNKSIYIILVLWFVTACGSSPEAALYDRIVQKEDSIAEISKSLQPGEMIAPKEQDALITLLKEYYQTYPEDQYAPECLDKLHMIYSSMGAYNQSSAYADTLLDKYPDYINRAMILESQASAYDFYIQPRDTAKVRHYYEMLLKEFPDLPEDKVKGVKDRLDNLDLSIEQMILQAD